MAKSLGIQVASQILTGDVSSAHILAQGLHSVTVPEGRAIGKACEIANIRWNAQLELSQFIAPLRA